MSHKIKYHTKPHRNADGSISTTRKDYFVTHKKRKGARVLVGVVHSKKDAEALVKEEKALTYGEAK